VKRHERRGGGVRRRWRRVASVTTVAVLGWPVGAQASTSTTLIPDAHYATVVSPRVPSGEAVSFTLVHHEVLTHLVLSCFPDAAVAARAHSNGYANVFVSPRAATIALVNGAFRFSGVADVSSSPRRADQVATASLTITGRYVAHGPSYQYFSAMDNQVTATLVFQGTATTSACTGLPANHVFHLYATRSVG